MSPAISVPSENPRRLSNGGQSHPGEAEYAHVQPLTLRPESEDDRVRRLRAIVAPHIESFNFCIGHGIEALSQTIAPVTSRGSSATKGNSPNVRLRFVRLTVMKPRSGKCAITAVATDILPSECRRAGISYNGELLGELEITVDNVPIQIPMRRIGRIPIMVCSAKCNLIGKSTAQLVEAGEEQYELGGYFIINGSEKLLRMIVVPRANAVISVRRDSNMRRGPLYTDVSVSIRCMRKDFSTVTMHMHYMRTGGASIRINVGRTEYFLPVGVVMRALLPSGTTARAIFDLIVGGDTENEALRASALAIVTDLDEWSSRFTAPNEDGCFHASVSQSAALEYIGRTFRVVLNVSQEESDLEAGVDLLRQYVLVHLSHGPYEAQSKVLEQAKADMLVHMVRKLVATASGVVEVDNADSPSHQELLLPGQLYLCYLREKLEMFLIAVLSNVTRELGSRKSNKRDEDSVKEAVARALSKVAQGEIITKHMKYFLATGNIRSRNGLDLPQAVGYAIVAERINYLRFITHFRSIHRGAFYANMRSTKVRKLLPEAWGFICPVQTPDGAPSGLLNHLASHVQISQGTAVDIEALASLVPELGADPAPGFSSLCQYSTPGALAVVVDGCVLGYVEPSRAAHLTQRLRLLKTNSNAKAIPDTTEIVHVPPSRYRGSGFYPGVYIFTGSSRMMRPVLWLSQRRARKSATLPRSCADHDNVEQRRGTVELIGTLEQVFLHIRPAVASSCYSVTPVGINGATHAEISSDNFMSEVAALTPFSDMNQGPRNIFQCQMAKQAMGTPCHNFSTRFDPKVYRLNYPQIPLVRNKSMQDPIGADLFPNGLNGIVAVISYTGYDMEDALVLNRGSVNRGFASGSVYVNKRINLDDTPVDKGKQFGPLLPEEASKTSAVDIDGLPCVGARVRKDDPLCVLSHLGASAHSNARDRKSLHWVNHKSVEVATIDEVQVVNSASYNHDHGQKEIASIRDVNIRTRIYRAPSVGDKFATRAGQKGTVAAIWPTEDMPFSETGMIPDILFNPNGFPSRMTIGMMIESMAGKNGALHGSLHDSTPFCFDENCRAVDYFGEQLARAGYNYYGNETLYSGYTGEPFEVNIFMGVIHYQRLRHMVSDKFQVRATGAINPLYRQPVGGRKRGGAIRFGEMERDGLLAHGASFLIRDRLAMASDMHVMHVCERCGSLLTPVHVNPSSLGASGSRSAKRGIIVCRLCAGNIGNERQDVRPVAGGTSTVHKVAMPYSFKYLVNELAAMNIRTVLELRASDDVVMRRHGF